MAHLHSLHVGREAVRQMSEVTQAHAIDLVAYIESILIVYEDLPSCVTNLKSNLKSKMGLKFSFKLIAVYSMTFDFICQM